MNGVEQALLGGIDAGTAILIPALGELIGQRAGVVNLGTEGCMLGGALAAYAVGSSTGSAWLGVGAGLVAGMAFGLGHAWMTVTRRAHQITSGLVIWFLALGVTTVFGTSYINQTVAPLRVLAIPGLSQIPWAGPILFRHDALVYLGYLLAGSIWVVLYRSRLGLLIRATGERPLVVAAAGGHPQLVQVAAVVMGAGLAGVGGAQLSVGYVDSWFPNMTSGYGFVAVAVVLFAAWRPLRVLAGAYLFGVSLAAASVLQAHGVAVNQYLLDALPYLVTLVALVAVTRKRSAQAPEALRKALVNTS